MKTGEPVESLSLSKFSILYMRNYQITYSNLSNCLPSVLMCLGSLLMLIKFSHSSRVLSSKQGFSWSIHVSFCIFNMLIMFLLTLFFHSIKILIIYESLGVLTLLFNLMLTGITSWLRHLSENLWFWKSAILHSNFSHCWNNLTFSIPYSDLIFTCRFLMLFDVIYLW